MELGGSLLSCACAQSVSYHIFCRSVHACFFPSKQVARLYHCSVESIKIVILNADVMLVTMCKAVYH